jgi:hypothetical protein
MEGTKKRCLNEIEKMVWAREDVAFISVEAMVRLLLPMSYCFWISSYERTGAFDSPSTKTPATVPSRTLRPPFGRLLGAVNRSWTCSL